MLPLILIAKGIAIKIGINQLISRGYMPQNNYVSASLKAVREDDLDEAIKQYKMAIKRKKPSDNTDIAYENICGSINLRKIKLEAKINHINSILHPPIYSKIFWQTFFQRYFCNHYNDQRTLKNSCVDGINILNDLIKKLDAKD